MKTKIETIANIIVILFAVIVGSVFLKDRLSTPAPEPDAVKAGDKLASLDGWDWAAHDQTLVLGLRKGCHFCEDSAPFYQRLTAQQQGGSNSTIVAVFPDAAEAVKEVVQSEGLRVHALARVPLERLKISGTPTFRGRTITGSARWDGRTSCDHCERQEIVLGRMRLGQSLYSRPRREI
jgi:hypothetical protein